MIDNDNKDGDVGDEISKIMTVRDGGREGGREGGICSDVLYVIII